MVSVYLEGFIEANILQLEGDEDKAKHKKSPVKAKEDHSRLHQGSSDSSCLIVKDTKANV